MPHDVDVSKMDICSNCISYGVFENNKLKVPCSNCTNDVEDGESGPYTWSQFRNYYQDECDQDGISVARERWEKGIVVRVRVLVDLMIF